MVARATKYRFLLVSSYSLVGVSLLCLLVAFTHMFIYGEPKQITTDASDPLVAEGTLRYMDEDAFQKYDAVQDIIGGIGFFSGSSGIFLHIFWKIKIKRQHGG